MTGVGGGITGESVVYIAVWLLIACFRRLSLRLPAHSNIKSVTI